MKYEKWIEKNCESLKGKTICVTGSTGGLASQFVKDLAYLGADLIFANRNPEKSKLQKQQLQKEFPNTQIKIIKVDMSDMNSVKLFVCKLKQEKIDILILNSAIYNVPIKTLNYGYNNVFQVNFIANYYIAKQIIPTMRKIKGSKIIAIGSIAHKFSKLDLNDIDFTKCGKQNKIYGNSKRFLMFSFYNLFKDSGVNLSIVHPGITLTNMTNHYPKIFNWIVKIFIKLFMPKPKKASLSVLAGIYKNTPDNFWIGPSKFDLWGYPKLKKLSTCSEKESQSISKTAETIYNKISK